MSLNSEHKRWGGKMNVQRHWQTQIQTESPGGETESCAGLRVLLSCWRKLLEEITASWTTSWPRQSRSLPLIPVLGMHFLPAVITAGAIFRAASMWERCVVETFWMIYNTRPSYSFYIHIQVWQVGVEIYSSGCPRKASRIMSCLLNLPPPKLESCTFSSRFLPCMYRGNFHLRSPWDFKPTICGPTKRTKKWAMGKRHLPGKSRLDIDLYVREGWCIGYTWTDLTWKYRGAPEAQVGMIKSS